MNPTRLLLVAFGLAATACGSGSGPAAGIGGIGSPFSIDFSSRTVRPGSEPVPETSVMGGRGQIFAEGAIGLELPCFSLDDNADLRNRRMTLTVVASADEDCTEPVDTLAYEALITGLDAATYDFLLVHQLPSTADTVLDEDVEVQ